VPKALDIEVIKLMDVSISIALRQSARCYCTSTNC